MAIDCRCPTCGTELKVAEKHAGRKVKCPRCAGVIAVGEGTAVKKLPVAEPIEPPRADTAEVIAEGDQAGGDASGKGFPNIVVDPAAGSLAGRSGGRKAKAVTAKKLRPWAGKPKWLVASGATAAVLAVAVVVVLVHRFGGSLLGPADQEQSVLVLDLPVSERDEAAVFLDGRRQKLPRSGPVELTVKPGRHRVVMLRRGYEQVEKQLSLKANDRHRYKPQWTRSEEGPTGPYRAAEPGGWLQSMEVAKRRAAAEHKDLLIALEGSDSGEKWKRMRKEVFDKAEFREQMEWRFVLVRIESPRKDEAQTEVAENYHVSKDLMVVLANAEGRPYGVEEYMAGGVETFVDRVVRWQEVGERLEASFLDVRMASGDEQLSAIEKAADLLTKALLKKLELIRFYRPTLSEWLALVEKNDKDNQKGAYEAVFAVNWLARLAEVEEKNAKETRQVIDELDDWREKRKFKNSDRAALMHLYAAVRLRSAEQGSEALEYVEKASDYNPKDPWLVFMLRQAEAYIRGYGHGWGTGFVVAADGHILTNHHVIKGGSKVSVRLPGSKVPLPAKVLAEDSERDMALVKIEIPDGIKLKPVRIAAAEVSRGAEIGVYGFPGGEEMGKGLKFTWGHVSDEPDQNEEKMYLLDCRVNPGNSGGPLCNNRGHVIGMVTLKVGGFGMDSYGMALPAKDLRAFLKEHLPEPEKQQTPEAGQTRLEWEEISRIVGPSVVMIVRSD